MSNDGRWGVKKLVLQVNQAKTIDATVTEFPGFMVMTPDVTANWIARVDLGDNALIAFPKFGTVGIGFEQEEDWNTNLPVSCDAVEIYDHIKHNKGSTKIRRPKALAAIELLVKYGREYLEQRKAGLR